MTKLYKKYYLALVRYSTNICGRESTAEDIVQEVFIKAANIPKHLEEKQKKDWLYTTARNMTLNLMQRDKLFNYEEPEESTEIYQEYVELHIDSSILPSKQKQVIDLIISGKTQTEISQELKWNISSVKTAYRQAVVKLTEKHSQ